MIFAAFTITAAFTSCLKSENNDNARILFTEIGMIDTNGQAIVTGATLDDGSKILFTNPGKSSWATTADSTYRAMMYMYLTNQQIQEGNASQIYQAELASLQEVLYFKIHSREDAKDWINDKDPIQFISGVRNNGYINMSLRIPTGATAESSKHIFGVALEEQKPKNKVLRFCHNQNGVSNAYSADVLASIPVKNLALDTDTVTVIFPTKDGEKIMKFVDAKQTNK